MVMAACRHKIAIVINSDFGLFVDFHLQDHSRAVSSMFGCQIKNIKNYLFMTNRCNRNLFLLPSHHTCNILLSTNYYLLLWHGFF